MKPCSILLILILAVYTSAEQNIPNATPSQKSESTPELYLGATVVSHEWSVGFGGNIAGGVRFEKRHYFGLDLTIAGNIEEEDAFSEAGTLFGMRMSYYFAPLRIKEILSVEIGFGVAYGSDEYENYHGSWGVPARLSLGNRKFAYYIDGFANVTYMSDLLGDFYTTPPYLASLTTGFRYRF